MRKRYFFIIPFFVSLLTFVALNLIAFIMVRDIGPVGFDSVAAGGFPFRWYSRNWIGAPPVDRVALVVNIIVTVIASYAIGKIIQWVFVKPNDSSEVKSLDGGTS